MRKAIIVVTSVLIISLATRLWIGVYQHDEFREAHYFIKYRPIWKWKFYSPIGMGDTPLSGLSTEQKAEQRLFDEFVSKQGMSK